MTRLVFDFECSGAQRNKAHPFDKRNIACNVGFRYNNNNKIWKLEYDETPYGESLQQIQTLLNECTELVGFNIKFDLHWLGRYGLLVPDKCRLFDCQLAYYILTHQKNQYPSLEEVSEYYGMEKKLDIVKTEYWDRGLDTNEVPYEILSEYLEQDLVVTEQVYEAIKKDVELQDVKMQKLISVSMQDLRVLQDTEKNGLLLNLEKSIRKGNEIVSQIEHIDAWLRRVFDAPWFNPDSGMQLSAVLYGGTISQPCKEDYVFTYKDGRTAVKTRNSEKQYSFKGIFRPLEGSELAKEGFYATNEATLSTILISAKGEYKTILETILKRSKLEKLRGTYYHGYPKKIEELGWEDNIIHSNFNQCVTISGRLSSTRPNIQNVAESVKEVFISRFK